MKIEIKNQTTIITNTENDLNSFFESLNKDYEKLENQNLIINLQSFKNMKNKDLNFFLPISKLQKKVKKSLVIVIEKFDFNTVSNNFNVVPTIQEAHDIIEMEDIERDLEL